MPDEKEIKDFEQVIKDPESPGSDAGVEDKAKASTETPGASPKPPDSMQSLLGQYQGMDIYEAFGEVVQVGFDWIGKRRLAQAKAKDREDEFNPDAWTLDQSTKRRIGRSGLIALQWYDVEINPKWIATIMFALIVKNAFDECQSREYRTKTRKKRKDAGQSRKKKTDAPAKEKANSKSRSNP